MIPTLFSKLSVKEAQCRKTIIKTSVFGYMWQTAFLPYLWLWQLYSHYRPVFPHLSSMKDSVKMKLLCIRNSAHSFQFMEIQKRPDCYSYKMCG